MKFNNYFKEICYKNMPIRDKKIKKLGTLKVNYVEATPFVFKGELMMFEWVRADSWAHNGVEKGYYHIINMETGKEYKPFAFEHAFGSAYCEDDTVYVHGIRGGDGWTNQIDLFVSKDLENWEMKPAITLPEDICAFNTSVCKGKDGYIMAIEVGTREGKHEFFGCNFTLIFAKSTDLINWELLPLEETMYKKDTYTACPSIRYYNDYYYIVNLESAPFERWIPYIVRTKDFITYEVGDINPFMTPDDDDKKLINPDSFTEQEKEQVFNAFDCNNSDIDFCDYKGKTVIVYSWGNQMGTEFLALAEYDGSLCELLESHFLTDYRTKGHNPYKE